LEKKKIIVLSVSSLILLILLGRIFIPEYLKFRELAKQNRELERRIEQVKQDNRRLKEEHQKMINDPLYLEKVAREKLGVVRKGEVVYKVLPPQEKQ